MTCCNSCPDFPTRRGCEHRPSNAWTAKNFVDKISDSPAGPWLLYGLAGIAILAIAAL